MSTGNDALHDERRAHRRYSIDSPISVCYLGDYSIQKCVQISEGGMLLSAQEACWSVGGHIEICFIIPGNKSIILYGEVVYDLQLDNKQRFAGVRFINISSTSQALLRQYISLLSKV